MSDVELLYETPETGSLKTTDEGKAYRSKYPEFSGPSLSGPTPTYSSPGPKGIGGSEVSVPAHSAPVSRSMTPQELMALSDKMEADFKRQLENSDGPAAKRLGSGYEANGYNTELTKGAEEAFQRSRVGKRYDSGVDYDLRGRWLGGEADGANGHGPDTYKKPNHPTFSNESQYADEQNPGGKWNYDGNFTSQAGKTGPEESHYTPPWLEQYMSKQPFTDPYHQTMPGRVDILNSNKYLSERERLKMLKDLRDKGLQ